MLRINEDVLSELVGFDLTEDLQSQLEIMNSRAGSPTVRAVSGSGRPMLLHSAVDPWAEAARLAGSIDLDGKSHVVVLGFGLGYHVLALARRIRSGSHRPSVIVVESDPELIRCASGHLDLRPLKEIDFRLIAGGTPASVASQLAESVEIATFTGLEVLVHPPSTRVNPSFYGPVKESILDLANSLRIGTNTVIHYSAMWQENYVSNLPDVAVSPGICELFAQFKGRPAFIVGAGPSLDKNVHHLRRAAGRSVILACDTALKSLLASDVTPDLVMSIDGSELNYHGFQGVSAPGVTLIYEPMTYHRIVAEWEGPKFVCSSILPLGKFVDRHLGGKGMLASGGSVSTNAFHLAYLLGCNPIVFVGQDLSYPDGRSYAAGTFYDEEKRAPGPDQVEMLEVPGVNGDPVLTPRFMYVFLKWFGESISRLQAANPDLELIDATEGGALIRGTKLMTLADTVTRYCQEPVSVADVVFDLEREFAPTDVTGLVLALKQGALRAKAAERNSRRALRAIRRYRAGNWDWDQCCAVLTNVDEALKQDVEASDLVEQFMQALLFTAVRKTLSNNDRDPVAESTRLYAGIAGAGYRVAEQLWEVAPRIEQAWERKGRRRG